VAWLNSAGSGVVLHDIDWLALKNALVSQTGTSVLMWDRQYSKLTTTLAAAKLAG
jgi:hypothetical protein